MVKYIIKFSSYAEKDKIKLKNAGLEQKAKNLLSIIFTNSFQNPPPYEKLKGELSGCYSRRISIQHKLIYEIDKENFEIHVLRMWTHYE